MTKHALRAAGLFTVLVLLAAGCGGQPFPQSAPPPTTAPFRLPRDPRAVLLASVQRASAEKTARVSMTMTFDQQGQSMSLTGDGLIDLLHAQLSLTMHGRADGRDVTIDMRLVGGKIYVNADGTWIVVPMTGTAVDTPNPSGNMQYLQGVSGGVRNEGTDVVRGVRTTRYGVNIDFDTALAHARTAGQRAVLAHALSLFGPAPMPATVWVDGQGRLRRLRISLDLGPALRRQGEQVSGSPKLVETMELYDFGLPVQITAPAGAADIRAAAQDAATQSDLRNALVAEKTYYTDQQQYSADPAQLQQIEPSLDWGGQLTVVVGKAGPTANGVVCLSEPSPNGTVFSIADVASGPYAGTYYGRTPCPPVIDEAAAVALGTRW